MRITSVNVLNGHRHYVVKEVKGKEDVKVVNSCGEPEDVWVTFGELKRKEVWRLGWVTLEEIREAERGALKGKVKTCHRCKGGREIECRNCWGMGEV